MVRRRCGVLLVAAMVTSSSVGAAPDATRGYFVLGEVCGDAEGGGLTSPTEIVTGSPFLMPWTASGGNITFTCPSAVSTTSFPDFWFTLFTVPVTSAENAEATTSDCEPLRAWPCAELTSRPSVSSVVVD